MNAKPRAISELIIQLARRIESQAFSSGLNPAQWRALRYLSGAMPSARSVAAFARYHESTTGTASQTIDSLVKKGLAVREPDPTDGRQNRLNLTDSGLRLLELDPIDVIAAPIGRLDEPSQLALLDVLTRILTDRGGEPSKDER